MKNINFFILLVVIATIAIVWMARSTKEYNADQYIHAGAAIAGPVVQDIDGSSPEWPLWQEQVWNEGGGR
jgi:hypothetical protein